jgi:uncharacterized protein (TIGR03435 family)
VKVPAGATRGDVNVMWQNLLASRFGVTLHHEPQEFQVEELVVAPGGPKLTETTWDAAAPLPSGPPQRDNKGALASPGQINMVFPREGGATVRTIAKAQPISQLTTTLSNQLNHPVLDKTGLTGRYDYTIASAVSGPAGVPPPPPGQPGPGAAGTAASDALPDLIAAVQQQLGLRLVRAKAQLDVVVIDKAGKVPSPN